jgi:hypothetical protein
MATPGDDPTSRSTPQPNASFQAINRMNAGQNDSGRSSRVASAPGTPKADDSATATKHSAPAPPDAPKASAQSDSYGTRSRRTGKERLNYAEDQDADFDFTSAATTTSYKKNAAASATNTQASTDAKRTKEPTQPAHSSANHQNIAKDPAPGATSASTNPKKRKAAGAATPTASTPVGGAAVSATNMRKQLPSSLPLARETNMLTFLRSKSCLNSKGELVADDGTKLNVNGKRLALHPFSKTTRRPFPRTSQRWKAVYPATTTTLNNRMPEANKISNHRPCIPCMRAARRAILPLSADGVLAH